MTLKEISFLYFRCCYAISIFEVRNRKGYPIRRKRK